MLIYFLEHLTTSVADCSHDTSHWMLTRPSVIIETRIPVALRCRVSAPAQSAPRSHLAPTSLISVHQQSNRASANSVLKTRTTTSRRVRCLRSIFNSAVKGLLHHNFTTPRCRRIGGLWDHGSMRDVGNREGQESET
jgi:hypothetical protein